ncbi:MAG: hypothetical protein LBJ02_00790 [Bifidobacteriaceae bacterium]|nr:hypothetical protein [Bifidobacteriaceae bacterium]
MRDQRWLQGFFRQVTEAVLERAGAVAPDNPPEMHENLHHALWLFHQKCQETPDYFNGVPHGVAWVLAKYQSLAAWTNE